MNRDFVLKNFWNKLTEAKKENVREIRLSLKEMDELGFVIYELLGEYFNKTIDNVKNNDNYDKFNKLFMTLSPYYKEKQVN